MCACELICIVISLSIRIFVVILIEMRFPVSNNLLGLERHQCKHKLDNFISYLQDILCVCVRACMRV